MSESTINISLAVVGALLTAASIIHAIYTNNLNQELKLQLRTITFEDIENFSEDVVEYLGAWQPDVIYCPDLRGGFVGYFVSKQLRLHVPILTGYVFSKRKPIPDCNIDNNYAELDTPGYKVLMEKYLYKFQGKKVLIVDEIVVTGEAIRFIKKSLMAKNFPEDSIKSCVVVSSIVAADPRIASDPSANRPDFCWRIIGGDLHDITFPWGRWN
jgi:hypoxanthine phosphoribosyltransferase